MTWEFRYKVDDDPCENCAGAVLIEYKRYHEAQGSWGPWIPQRAWCSRTCVVVQDAEERLRRHIARREDQQVPLHEASADGAPPTKTEGQLTAVTRVWRFPLVNFGRYPQVVKVGARFFGVMRQIHGPRRLWDGIRGAH